MPNARAILAAFFSIRILVAPQPYSSAAYSAKKAAKRCNATPDADLFLSQVFSVIITVAWNVEYFLFLTELYKVQPMASCALGAFPALTFHCPEYDCAQQRRGHYTPYYHSMCHNIFGFFNSAAKLLPLPISGKR